MSVVYFVQDGNSAIKIGTTINLDGRIAALKTSCSTDVSLLASIPGDKRTEAFFHGLLQRHRMSGEWFAPGEQVLQVIEDVRANGVEVVPDLFRLDEHQRARTVRDGSDLLAHAKQWIEELSKPAALDEKVIASLRRVAKIAGVSYRSIKSIWYDETTGMSALVYVALKEAFDLKVSREMARTLRGLDRAGSDGE